MKKAKINVATFQEQETPCKTTALNYYVEVMKLRGGEDDIALLQELLWRCR